MSRMKILLVTRSATVADDIAKKLAHNPAFKLTTKIISNGHVDPMFDAGFKPDLLLLHCVSTQGELEFLASESRAPDRPPLIVLGPPDNSDVMRLALRAGASDYLVSPLNSDELIGAIERLADTLAASPSKSGELVTVVNSRGGSGSSFLAANLAYGFFSIDDLRTLLVDCDLQFGGLCRYFDVNPKKGIIEALDAVEDLDEVSGETYITRHKSGMRLLAACSDSLFVANDISTTRIDILLRMLLEHNEMVVVDLPRRIDMVGATILESSDHILLVVQQSLSHLHDAMRMIRLITQELRVPSNRIIIVINRFDKKSIIEVGDVRHALKIDRTVEIPNQFNLVSESIDTGKPLVDRSRNSAVAKAIGNLRNHIRGVQDDSASQSILQRALPALLKRTP